MTLQYGTLLRNNQLDQVEVTLSTTPRLHMYTGAVPANCAAVATGTKLIDTPLPSDWMNAASGGTKTLLGAWTGVGLAAAGTGTAAGYFRLYDSTGTTCHVQGTITVTAGGGDMTLDNTSIAENQNITVTSFVITAGNP